MMRENKQLVHYFQTSVKAKTERCGSRYYNIKLYRIFKQFGECAITNYRIIRNYEQVREDFIYSLEAYEDRFSFKSHKCGQKLR